MVTIFHNPRCSTSRRVLEIIRERGLEPQIVDYQKNPLSRKDLVSLLVALDISPRNILRKKEEVYISLNLSDPSLTDIALIDALIAHPILMERPIVLTDKGAKICRPVELVHELL